MSVFTSEGDFLEIDLFKVDRHFETTPMKKGDEPIIRQALWRVCNNCFCNVRCQSEQTVLPDNSVKIKPRGDFDRDSRCWFFRETI